MAPALAAVGMGAVALASVVLPEVAAAVVSGSAVTVEPTAVFARAVGVLKFPFVETIAGAPTAIVFARLGAAPPASVSFGGVGRNESRIFSAAAASCARICGICSKTVSAGSHFSIKVGMKCWRMSP